MNVKIKNHKQVEDNWETAQQVYWGNPT